MKSIFALMTMVATLVATTACALVSMGPSLPPSYGTINPSGDIVDGNLAEWANGTQIEDSTISATNLLAAIEAAESSAQLGTAPTFTGAAFTNAAGQAYMTISTNQIVALGEITAAAGLAVTGHLVGYDGVRATNFVDYVAIGGKSLTNSIQASSTSTVQITGRDEVTMIAENGSGQSWMQRVNNTGMYLIYDDGSGEAAYFLVSAYGVLAPTATNTATGYILNIDTSDLRYAPLAGSTNYATSAQGATADAAQVTNALQQATLSAGWTGTFDVLLPGNTTGTVYVASGVITNAPGGEG